MYCRPCFLCSIVPQVSLSRMLKRQRQINFLRQIKVVRGASRSSKSNGRPAAFLGHKDSENLKYVAKTVDQLHQRVNTTDTTLTTTATTLSGRVDDKVTAFSASLRAELAEHRVALDASIDAQIKHFYMLLDLREKMMDARLQAQQKLIEAQFTAFKETVAILGQCATILVTIWAASTGKGMPWHASVPWILIGGYLLWSVVGSASKLNFWQGGTNT